MEPGNGAGGMGPGNEAMHVAILASFPDSTPQLFYRTVYKSDKNLGSGVWERG